MAEEYQKGRWFELVFGLAAGAFLGALGTVYLTAQRDERIAGRDRQSIETVVQATKKDDTITRAFLIDNAEKFLIYGNPEAARKNIEHYLKMNPTKEEQINALKFLDRIATHYRKNDRPKECADIYRKVFVIAPEKADEIMDPENVDLAKALANTPQDSH